MVLITWRVRCDATQMGEQVSVLGTFNAWRKHDFVTLQTTANDYPTWTASSTVPNDGKVIEYKYVITKDGAIHRWETDTPVNRVLSIPTDGSMDLKIDDIFGQILQHQPVHQQQQSGNGDVGHSSLLSVIHNQAEMDDRSTMKDLDEIQCALVRMNDEKKSWRNRLQFVRSLFTNEEFSSSVRTLRGLVSVCIYLTFLSSGQVSCCEDGGHYRPNHHAHEAKLIDHELSRLAWTSGMKDDDNNHESYIGHVVRRVMPHLPSYSSQFTVSVPLTRIRDIAHRGDIPRDLKQEIKHTLQNKLHRCAGPEDFRTSEAILGRITQHGGSHYSQAFVEEFKIFHEELRAFFNRSSLDERLKQLPNAIGQPLLSLKQNAADPIVQLRELVRTREAIATLLSKTSSSKSSPNGLVDDKTELPTEMSQKTWLADIELESYAFVLLAALAKRLENIDSASTFPFTLACEILCLCARMCASSLLRVSENTAMANELSAVMGALENNSSSTSVLGKALLMRLRAAVERSARFARSFSTAIVTTFSQVAPPLGDALGVERRATTVLPEAEVRASIPFQQSRVASVVERAVRKQLGLPPWDAVHSGSVVADAVHYVSSLSKQVEQAHSAGTTMIVVCQGDENDGDQDVPPHVKGIVIGRHIPHLSHLALRARQAGVVLVCAEDSDAFATVWTNRIQGRAKLQVNVTDGLIGLKPEHSTSLTVAKKFRQTVSMAEMSFDKKTKSILDIRSTTRAQVSTKAFIAGKLLSISESSGGLFRAAVGVAIPHGVFQQVVRQHFKKYRSLVSKYDAIGNGSDADVVSKFVRDEFKSHASSLTADIQRVLNNDKKEKSPKRVMVRSSANAEDLERMSGAGLYDTVGDVELNDSGALSTAIATVWASLWTRRAASSRRAHRVCHENVSMAVLVQEMVNADLAFVAFSHDPRSSESSSTRSTMYVEVCIGLGETLASATQQGIPYRFSIERESNAIKEGALASYSRAIVQKSSTSGHGNSGTSDKITVDYSKQTFTTDPKLRKVVAKRIARTVECLERNLGGPQDIEGCITFDDKVDDGVSLFVVQARPQVLL